jgi:hypothetical protein
MPADNFVYMYMTCRRITRWYKAAALHLGKVELAGLDNKVAATPSSCFAQVVLCPPSPHPSFARRSASSAITEPSPPPRARVNASAASQEDFLADFRSKNSCREKAE